MSLPRHALLLIVSLLVWDVAAAAEGDFAVSADAGPLLRLDEQRWAGAVTLGGAYGLSDAWVLHADLGESLARADGKLLSSTRLVLGMDWIFDVLQIVPFAGLGVATILDVSRSNELDLGAEVRVGFDYLLQRSLGLGLVARALGRFRWSDEFPIEASLAVRMTFAVGS